MDAGESDAVAGGGPAAGANASEPKTNMLLLLIPWIVFLGLAAAIDGLLGKPWSALRYASCCPF